MLEALLKRVDGLERRLKDEKKSHSPNNEGDSASVEESINGDSKPKPPQLDTTITANESAVYSPSSIRFEYLVPNARIELTNTSEPSPGIQTDALLDTYFTRCHGKAYHILDETNTRQRVQLNQIPSYLLYAIYAVSAR